MPMIKNKPQFLQAMWPAPANIKTLITTNYEGFNLATHTNDNQQKIATNRNLLNNYLPSQPQWLEQTHGTEVIDLDNTNLSTTINADASITRIKHKVCVVMTADCLAILLTTHNGDFVSAIHAGWRGLVNGIITNCLAQLNQYNRHEIIAFIGPAICEQCFEVGQEVAQQFIQQHPSSRDYCIMNSLNNKALINLRAIAAMQLHHAGIPLESISNANICTKCNPQWFYSYRANASSGRIASLIWKT